MLPDCPEILHFNITDELYMDKISSWVLDDDDEDDEEENRDPCMDMRFPESEQVLKVICLTLRRSHSEFVLVIRDVTLKNAKSLADLTHGVLRNVISSIRLRWLNHRGEGGCEDGGVEDC